MAEAGPVLPGKVFFVKTGTDTTPGGDGWTYIGETDGAGIGFAPLVPVDDLEPVQWPKFPVTLTVTADTSEASAALRFLIRQVKRLIRANKDLARANKQFAHVTQNHPGSYSHCRACHPEQAPRPLAVNGNEYRRRQRARQRRRLPSPEPQTKEDILKLEAPENINYAATVVSIASITPLENCDNVVGTPILGFQAIVGKATAAGDLGVVFPAEAQLSEEYARLNNLHRHGNLNDDESAKGYLEDNRRVKALKFRGHRSDCLFMPLSSLGFTGADIAQLQPGDVFDTLNGHPICRKYVVKRAASGPSRVEKNKVKVFRRVDEKMLPEHYDTDNFFRNRGAIAPGRHVVVTQKLHGTSIRIGNTIVRRKLTLRERIAARLGVRVQQTEFANVYGSRKVIKDVNNPHQNHFYGADIWSEEGAKLNGLVPENYIVYGELIGWTKDGAPIQKNYTYQVPEGTCELWVYRVAIVNGQGRIVDLAWDQLTEFCRDLGLKFVPPLWRGPIEDLDIENFLDAKFSECPAWSHAVRLDKASPCDEGVCVRVDGLAPYILKAKSPAFLRHETKMLDQEAPDLEADGSLTEEEAA